MKSLTIPLYLATDGHHYSEEPEFTQFGAIICSQFVWYYIGPRPQVIWLEAHTTRPKSWGSPDCFKVTAYSTWSSGYVSIDDDAIPALLYPRAQELLEQNFADTKTIFVQLHTTRPK